MKKSWLLMISLIFSSTIFTTQADVLIEAESFKDLGGWVLDQQFMDQMGSPYLMAHGYGYPVKNAQTQEKFSRLGVYHVYVRTRDWVAPHGPGQFKIRVNSKELDTTFGKGGSGKWEWTYGGTISITTSPATIELKDLTGFNGRCDAIYFADQQNPTLPNDLVSMQSFRKRALGLPDNPPSAGKFDFVVIGGGYAGCNAAIACARYGMRVALIQDRPVIGGNGSAEIRVGGGGGLVQGNGGNNAEPAAKYPDSSRMATFLLEPNISLFMETRAFKVEMNGRKIIAVIAKNVRTGQELRFEAPFYSDCTGDGVIGFLAGAEYRMGRESKDETGERQAVIKSDSMHMGMSNLWRAYRSTSAAPFPEKLPWALQFTNSYLGNPGGDGLISNWDWEGGFWHNPINEMEYIRDYNLRAIFGAFASFKNDPNTKTNAANWRFEWIAYVGGKRESRRLIGDYILLEHDLLNATNFPDGVVRVGWHIDIHCPTMPPKTCKTTNANGGQDSCEPFRSYICTEGKPIVSPIPYRCLYSKNTENLFMAGRCISVSHLGLGPVRIMSTTAAMGEVVGRAAAYCVKNGTTCRSAYQDKPTEFIAYLKTTLPSRGKNVVAVNTKDVNIARQQIFYGSSIKLPSNIRSAEAVIINMYGRVVKNIPFSSRELNLNDIIDVPGFYTVKVNANFTDKLGTSQSFTFIKGPLKK